MDRQRIDKWLWHARVVRTRTAAAALAESGHVRLNSQRIDAASRTVRVGDVVAVALDRTVRVLKVSGFAERRGSADDARGIYEDLTPAPEPAKPEPAPIAEREPGAGRPTKRERRAIGRFTGEDGQ
ncbi:MAG TPA: S4 domain-containing protein [Xanthobacteraceae bacterium]|nr:S4 domain-containing protein [Xanthobacteraceae bacterium]